MNWTGMHDKGCSVVQKMILPVQSFPKLAKSRSYDALNRLASITQTLSGAPGGTISTSYNNDAYDNVTSVVDANSNSTTYTYDDFGEVVKIISPSSGTTTQNYDSAGNLTSSTDARNITATLSYDSLNRLISVTFSNSNPAITNQYDNASVPFSKGLLTRSFTTAIDQNYKYDRRRLMVSKSQATGSTSLFARFFQFDQNGNRTQYKLSFGESGQLYVDVYEEVSR